MDKVCRDVTEEEDLAPERGYARVISGFSGCSAALPGETQEGQTGESSSSIPIDIDCDHYVVLSMGCVCLVSL